MEIKNNVDSGYKAKLIDFNELQPINLKIPMYSDITKKSIISRGFVQPFAMCKIDDKLYIIDGHLRHDLINELINDGYKVPNEFSYYLIDVKNDFEIAIDTLMSFNVKVNPIDLPALNEWVKIKQISVNIEELNVKIEQIYETENEPDYSLLDDDDEELQRQTDQMTAGVKKAIQIEFEAEHYEDAYALVKFWREQNAYVGGMIMEYLKSEKEKI